MTMKNYFAKTASVAALILIGLLVITGCQGLFEPPAKTGGDGTGTLMVSFNDNVGRTILPTAALDRYELNVTDNDEFDEDYVLTGSSGIPLDAGTYDLSVQGFIQKGEDTNGDPIWLLIAKGSVSSVVVTANDIASASIALTPSDNPSDTTYGDEAGNGYFAWDFSEVELTSIEVSIFEVGASYALGNIVGTASTEKVDEVILSAGIYYVQFEVGAGGETYSWMEVLYVYVGLTSEYGPEQFATSDVFPTIPYVVPASGYGYFYVDLNNWKNIPHSSLTQGLTKAVTATNDITVPFTTNNQFLSFALTAEQSSLLSWSKEPITITIKGSTVSGTSNYRYYLGNITQSSWNATNGSGSAAFSTFADEDGISKTQTFHNNFTNGTTGFDHFILQFQGTAAETIKISSIKIGYNLGDDGFDLDLSAIANTSSNHASNPTAITPTYDSDTGVLTGSFTSSTGRLIVALTDAQIEALIGEGTVANPGASDVYVTVFADGTLANDSQFRYHLGKINDNSNWNVTGAAGGNAAFSAIASADGKTIKLALSNIERIVDDVTDAPDRIYMGYFILNKQAGGNDTINISRIRIDYDNKPIAVPPAVCECTSCAVTGKTLAQAKADWLFPTCTGADLSGCPVCSAIGAIPFDITTGFPGLELGVIGSNAPVLTAGNTIATVTASSSSGFYITLGIWDDGDDDSGTPDTLGTWVDDDDDPSTDDIWVPSVDVTQAITITYSCIIYPGEVAPFIYKKAINGPSNDPWPTINNGGGPGYNAYKQFETGQNKTLVLPAGSLDDGESVVIGFQHNNNDSTTAKYQIKIISISN